MDRASVRRRLLLGVTLVIRFRPTAALARGFVRSLVTSFLALGVTLWLLPGEQTTGPAALLVLVLIVAGVSLVLRPVLLSLAVLLGPLGLLLVGVLAQAVILDVALAVAPGSFRDNFVNTIIASWSAAAVAAFVNWTFDGGSEDAFLAQVLGRVMRVAQWRGDTPGSTGPGMLVVQLDGVSEPVLRQALRSGNVPTLARWLRSGSHTFRGWQTGLPSTTPAGQAALLHGDVHTVPAFRWYEKGAFGADGLPAGRGRLLVANRPRDAAAIEARMSDGRGLLADGGVSVSNLFSGDAPTKLLTMSDARLPPRSTRGLASFAVARGGLLGSLLLFFGEMLTELQQGRRQRRRNVQPRVRRGGVFAVLRAVTTVLLRDLAVSIVSEQMARGAPVIFVDFVDYDEVAHHAGPSRPEAMRTLDGLDRVLALFERVSAEVGRHYEIVVLSDHGQAQGATFVQQCGQTLTDVVRQLADLDRADESAQNADTDPAERWGPANVLLTGAARADTMTGGATRRVMRGHTDVSPDGSWDLAVTLGEQADRGRAPLPQPQPGPGEALVVAAGGSMAHVYLTDVPGRVGRAAIDARYPFLIEGLAEHPQIGVVLVRSEAGLLALGATGWRHVAGDTTTGGDGDDPLAHYGPRAAADVSALDRREHVGDLVVLGALNPVVGEVTAFEELVGSHGGLGGGQTDAVLVHPADWPAGAAGSLTGRAVFDLLLGRLGTLGLRPGDVPAAGAQRTPVAG